MYRHIGGRSPILAITSGQAEALEEALNGPGVRGKRLKVSVGMRYWHPSIEEAVRRMYDGGIRRALALSLYPHYSLATSGSSLSVFTETAKKYGMESSAISSWPEHPLYIDALADVIRKGMAAFGHEGVEVLFSAHSLPLSIIEAGDPYVKHITGTIDEVVKKTGIRWHLSYQSKSGPVAWLSPSTEEKIRELAQKGVRDLLVVPISFVSDHIETLYEIDILYKGLGERLGMKLVRAESLNTHPLFINALKDLVLKRLDELRW